MNNNSITLKCQDFNFDGNRKLLKAMRNSTLFNRFFSVPPPGQKLQPEWITHTGAKVPDCPLGMSKTLQLDANKINNATQDREDPLIRYPKLAEEMRAGYITTSTLNEAVFDHLSRAPLILFDHGDGGSSIFRGQVRGCKSYANRQQRRVQDAAKNLADIPGSTLFVTITYHPSTQGADIIEAQAKHATVVRKFLKRARRYHKCHYISVLEQTLNGYPHTHILLKFDGVYKDYYKNKLGRLLLRDKSFFRRLKSWQPNQQFKVLVVYDKSVVTYLSKYIAKGMSKPTKSEGELTQDQLAEVRKSRLCYMTGYMTHSRQLAISQSLRNPPKTAKVEEIEADGEAIDTMATMQINTDEAEHILIRILNNLTSICRSHVQMIFSPTAISDLRGEIGYHDRLDFRISKKFNETGVYLGCPGCIVTQIVDDYRQAMSHAGK